MYKKVFMLAIYISINMIWRGINMAKYRYLYCEFWRDGDFEGCSMDLKFLYIYLLTNSHSAQCGIYRLSIREIAFETEMTAETAEKLIQKLEDMGKIRYSRETREIGIKNWKKYNATSSPKVQACINSELQKVKDKTLIPYVMGTEGMEISSGKDEDKPDMACAVGRDKASETYGVDTHKVDILCDMSAGFEASICAADTEKSEFQGDGDRAGMTSLVDKDSTDIPYDSAMDVIEILRRKEKEEIKKEILKNKEKEKEVTETDVGNVKDEDVYKDYERKINRLTASDAAELSAWLTKVEPWVIIAAIDVGYNRGLKTMEYIGSVLGYWHKKGVTAADVPVEYRGDSPLKSRSA